jgi:hypothetical protein
MKSFPISPYVPISYQKRLKTNRPGRQKICVAPIKVDVKSV